MCHNKELTNTKRLIIAQEYLRRRKGVIKYYYFMIHAWNDELDRLYPDRVKRNQEYHRFIQSKMKGIIDAANKTNIGLNLVKLQFRDDCSGPSGVVGICKDYDIMVSTFLKVKFSKMGTKNYEATEC